jgi:hypothetical protein
MRVINGQNFRRPGRVVRERCFHRCFEWPIAHRGFNRDFQLERPSPSYVVARSLTSVRPDRQEVEIAGMLDAGATIDVRVFPWVVDNIVIQVRAVQSLEAGWSDPKRVQTFVGRGVSADILFDPQTIKIDRFVDDAGTELSTTLTPETRSQPYMAAPAGRYIISTDGHHALVHFALEDTPAAGATRFALRGSVGIRVGFNEQTAEQKDVPIQVNSAIKVGPLTLTLKSVTSQTAGYDVLAGTSAAGNAVMLGFSTKQDADMVRRIEFTDENGQSVPCALGRMVNYNNSAAQPLENTFTCTLGHDVAKAAVKVTYFERVEAATVPLQLTGDVGL